MVRKKLTRLSLHDEMVAFRCILMHNNLGTSYIEDNWILRLHCTKKLPKTRTDKTACSNARVRGFYTINNTV